MTISKINQSKKSFFRMGMYTIYKLIQNLGSKREQSNLLIIFEVTMENINEIIHGANIPD